MPLPFQPNCQPLSLGGLPHPDVAAAWSTMLRHLTAMPSVPMPASQRETLATIGATGFGGVHNLANLIVDRDAALQGLDALYAAYLRGDTATRAVDLAALSFLQRSEQPLLRRCRAVFGTLIGPLSLGLLIADQQGVPVLANPTLLDALAQHLFLRQLWLHHTLRRWGKPVVVWIYEPFGTVVRMAHASAGRDALYGALDQTLGNETPRALWLPDIAIATDLLGVMAVDLLGVPLPPVESAPQVAEHVGRLVSERRGIAWGIVPVTAEALRSVTVGRLVARFEVWVQALQAAGVPVSELVAASLVMPEDTLAHLTPVDAERALALAAELASALQQAYGIQ